MEILARIRSSNGGRGLLQDMKKVVYQVDIPDGTAKRKAMKAVSTLRGIDFIAIDIKAKTLIVIGLVDPVDVVSKLRKTWPTDIISVGPAKEPEKPKEEPKKEDAKEEKEEPKKEETKKEEGKGEEGKQETKKEEPKKEEEKKKEQPASIVVQEILKAYQRAYYPPPYTTAHSYAHSMEENPNACVIS